MPATKKVLFLVSFVSLLRIFHIEYQSLDSARLALAGVTGGPLPRSRSARRPT